METHELESILQGVPILQFLPPDMRAMVESSFVAVAFAFGQEIVREGEPSDALYVLVSGRARVIKRSDSGDEISLGNLRPGDLFGEDDIFHPGVRPATVRASSAVEALRLDQSVVAALLQQRPELRQYLELQQRHRHLQGFFHQFNVFGNLPPEAQAELLTALEPVDVPANHVVIREGDPPGPMYIVEEGRCRVHVGVDNRRRNVAFLRKGEFFGELSVLRHERRGATVETVTDCRLLRLTIEAFQSLLERYPGFHSAIEERVAQYDYKHTAAIPIDLYREMLPADAAVQEKVGDDQLDAPSRRSEEKRARAEPDEEPFADDEGRFVKSKKRIRRFPHLWQIDEMDCGATSLAIICRYFGRAVSQSRIRQLVHTGLDGASLRAICEGGNELGLSARAVKSSPSNLQQMPLPAIVHWDGNHWVVLYDVDKTHVRISDPGLGKRRIPIAEFLDKWTGYAALFEHTTEFDKNPESKLGISWLLPFFKPYRSLILNSTALALIVSALQMVIPVFTQVIVDRVLVEQDRGLLRILIIGMVAIIAFTLAATMLSRYLLSWMAVRVDSATLDFLTRRLLSLPMSYFNTRRTGDIQRRLAGIWQVREFLVEHGTAALTATAQLMAALLLMIVYSPTLTLVFLATVPLFVIVLKVSSARLFPLYAELEETHGKYSSFQIDAIKGIETVKALGAEHNFRDLMLRQFNSVARNRFKADFTLMSYHGVVHSLTLLSTVLFLFVSATQVMDGKMSIGALVAFSSLVALANAPILTLMGLWDNMQQVAVYLNRLDDIFQQEPEQGHDRSRLLPVKSLEGRIAARHLTFRYGGPEAPPILDDLNFEIPPNTMVAIVGRSGSGKTTLIKCLAGLLEPTGGTILFDGIDLRTLNYRQLRRKVGFVLQENHLFDDSVARNIAFGEEEPDMDQVMWAAQVSNAREFIERLPFGYDTKIGESGLGLSGGQKQRVAIARAVYQRPPILIFDEATSALDTESERAVKENIDQLLEGRTSFVIAHRLSTVRDADLILVLEKGKLVEQGTHDDLMKREGLYYFLVSQQLQL
ncbi:MAG TPA: peptidase domain-containing ABC transporter [Gemmatimonadales bacterium]|nr:peptidase domain-containing ABC transporter [Gemmatimonadales bacterium]